MWWISYFSPYIMCPLWSRINIWMNHSHDIHHLHDSWSFIPYILNVHFYTIFTFSTFHSFFITQVHYQEYGLHSQAYRTLTYVGINSLVRVIHVMNILLLSLHHVSPMVKNQYLNESFISYFSPESFSFYPTLRDIQWLCLAQTDLCLCLSLNCNYHSLHTFSTSALDNVKWSLWICIIHLIISVWNCSVS